MNGLKIEGGVLLGFGVQGGKGLSRKLREVIRTFSNIKPQRV
jgi:hypothetical protein